MNIETAMQITGTSNRKQLAESLGVKAQAVYQWGENIPKGREYQVLFIGAQKRPHKFVPLKGS